MKYANNPLVRSILVTVAVFVLTVVADLKLGREGINRIDLMLSGDALAALAFGVVYMVFALRAEEKRLRLERQLQVIAEMNHHIRNALQAIVYVQNLQNQEYAGVVAEAVKRIEWALNEILPADGSDRRDFAAAESGKIDKIHATE
ncbi:MAG: hypothetical protein ABI383_01695 [Acidobacteriaceae bacterium]